MNQFKSAVLTIDVTRQERREEVVDGRTYYSWHKLADGTKSGVVTLRIDVEQLFDSLGHQALRNKSGRAHIASGMIEAVVDKKTIKRSKPV